MASSVEADDAAQRPASAKGTSSVSDEYQQRVEAVRNTPGLVAFWDFVLREDGPGGSGNFLAHTAAGDEHRYVLEPHNLSRDFWHDGNQPELADFPLLGRGPFGQAVQFQYQKAKNDMPVLLVPRAALHDTPLDIKGPRQSVTMVVWINYEKGNHAIAGMWHEGTDSPPGGVPPVVRERGRRQFGMFAGLSANPGGVGAHISDNGLASFGDTYARHFAITPEKIPAVAPDAGPAEVDAGWAVAGFVFDNERNQIAAYLNGVSSEFWSDADQFYRSAATAWKQAQLAKTPGLQPGERPDFPADQYYNPPQTELQSEEVVSESAEERVVVRTYAFTKVGVTYRKDAQGKFTLVGDTQLLAIKANPYWFNHDIYAPPSATEGGPFTIGRVIHSNRSSTLAAHIGGVAVYNRALSAAEMQTLAAIGRSPEGEASGEDAVLKLSELNAPRANP